MTRYTMKIDVQSKGFLPDNVYATGTFATIIDIAKHYNGKPITEEKSSSFTERRGTGTVEDLKNGGFAVTQKQNIFRFYRAYTK